LFLVDHALQEALLLPDEQLGSQIIIKSAGASPDVTFLIVARMYAQNLEFLADSIDDLVVL